ncbi:MAG: dihydroorotate dehydrogenase [Methanomassiliicoccales archaeon]|nr:MAG: dihydroorotate dehydrogenase [Methanomassiliicoccales archaeon]
MVDLQTSVGELKLKNPTMLASGILGETGELLMRVAESGAGAVVTKSIGLEPREGHPNPTVIEFEFGLLNAVGLANPGIEDFREQFQIAKKGEVPVIGSIFGKGAGEFVDLATKMEDYGASAVELNLSCPHAEGLGQEIGAEPKNVELITKEVKGSVSIPVFPKLTPNVKDIVALADAASKGGADAVVAINSVRAMAISPETKMPILANKIGGLSGTAIRPIGVRCVYEIWREVSIPIIGVGGISSGMDALQYLMAGASAVQIGSGVWIGGPGVFSNVCKEIEEFLEENGHKSVKEVIGAAHSC